MSTISRICLINNNVSYNARVLIFYTLPALLKVTQFRGRDRLPDGDDSACVSEASAGIHCSAAGELTSGKTRKLCLC